MHWALTLNESLAVHGISCLHVMIVLDQLFCTLILVRTPLWLDPV